MKWAVQFKLSFLAVGLCCLQIQAAPKFSASDSEQTPPERSSYDREMFQRIAREQQDRYRKRVAIPADALVESSQVAGSKGSAGTRTGIGTGPKFARMSRKNLLLVSLCLLAWILAFWKFATQVVAFINAKWNPWAISPSAAARFASRVRAEEQAFAEFVAAFRVGQTAAPRPATVTLRAPVCKVPE